MEHFFLSIDLVDSVTDTSQFSSELHYELLVGVDVCLQCCELSVTDYLTM